MSEWVTEKNTTGPTNLNGEKISKSVSTLVKASLSSLNLAYKLAPNHFVKLARANLNSLKTGFTKMLQDYYRYQTCSGCALVLMNTAKNDLETIYAAIQFIVAGLGPVQTGGDAFKLFSEFSKVNKKAIQDDVKFFLQ